MLLCSICACSNSTTCEAFEIMSEGSFSIVLSLESDRLVYAQHEGAVVLCEIDENGNLDSEELLLTKNGAYVLNTVDGTYSPYVSTDINYNWLFFQKNDYTFKAKELSNGTETFVYKRGNALLSYVYRSGVLSEIRYSPNTGYANDYTIRPQVISITAERDPNLLFEVPSGFTLSD